MEATSTVWKYPRILMADIIAEVSHVFRMHENCIKGRDRRRPIVRARFACCYLARKLTSLSYPQIGAVLGGRDHSSTLHGDHTALIYMEHDPEYRAYVDAVRIRLLTVREREKERRRQAAAVERERKRLEGLAAERAARKEAEAAERALLSERQLEMDDLSRAVATFKANGGSFVEVRA